MSPTQRLVKMGRFEIGSSVWYYEGLIYQHPLTCKEFSLDNQAIEKTLQKFTHDL